MMVDNVELFEEEIDEIDVFSDLDKETFQEIIEYSRGVIAGLGNRISPVAVVDVISEATSNMMYSGNDEEVTVEMAVDRAVANLHLADELEALFGEVDNNGDEVVFKHKNN